MSKLLRSYLRYARGERKISPWALLYPLQFITRLWMKLRINLYARGLLGVTEPPLPVVSIGNNSLGGTNKTPMTELVVRQFQEAGIEAGLVSRGYRTKEHGPIWIGQDEESTHRNTAGDEPLMLAKRLPGVKIVVSRDRVQGVALLASLGAKVAVTDDTFQHRRMARDVDIVLVDATCPFGNGNVIPAGSMREPKSAFSRADILVITKANQANPSQLASAKAELEKLLDPHKIFTAEIKMESWIEILRREERSLPAGVSPRGNYIAFSAIGSPAGFYRFLEQINITISDHRTFRDHHIFTESDINGLVELAKNRGVDGFICTEKDLVNLPEGLDLDIPIYIPRIVVTLDDDLGFRKKILEKLKPNLMIASNGYGEDAIGVVLAKKMKKRFTAAEVSAFAFVGSGTHYRNEGFRVLSPSIEMPSGGVIKYSLIEFIKDLRHGLGSSITSQMSALSSLYSRYRTPVCVGDVYLIASMLWGQGMKPVLVATAKSVHLSGHLSVEQFLLKHRSRFVWTRDSETAEELRSGGVNAEFCGNPVMDLIDKDKSGINVWKGTDGHRILLLPGSRPRTYEDVILILDSAKELSKRKKCSFVMVPAPMIDVDKLVDNLGGWVLAPGSDMLESEGIKVRIYRGEVADAALGADLLIGLGGTANQLCAGLGVPVVSILEKGKLIQKKLLKEAEILVKAEPQELAKAAERILSDPELKNSMKDAGIRNLGGFGALDHVVEYCASALGWDNRCAVYEKYRFFIEQKSENGSRCKKEMLPGE